MWIYVEREVPSRIILSIECKKFARLHKGKCRPTHPSIARLWQRRRGKVAKIMSKTKSINFIKLNMASDKWSLAIFRKMHVAGIECR